MYEVSAVYDVVIANSIVNSIVNDTHWVAKGGKKND